MYHGRIVTTLPAESATREDLGLLMAGGQLGPRDPARHDD
jgi:simple sugar transport system ATP-binding protein